MFLAVFAVPVVLRADMLSTHSFDTGTEVSSLGRRQSDLQTGSLLETLSCPGENSGAIYAEFSCEPWALARDTDQKQSTLILENGPDSLNLCLSALIGLGMCTSARGLKRLHYGHFAQWYHNGGPIQVGHVHAATPESLLRMADLCFAQTVCTAEDSDSGFHFKETAPLWRKSQFTPEVLASRPPPCTS